VADQNPQHVVTNIIRNQVYNQILNPAAATDVAASTQQQIGIVVQRTATDAMGVGSGTISKKCAEQANQAKSHLTGGAPLGHADLSELSMKLTIVPRSLMTLSSTQLMIQQKVKYM
jgi:hypothetical protein